MDCPDTVCAQGKCDRARPGTIYVHDNLCHPAEKLYKDYLGALQYGNIFSLDVGPNYAGKLRDIDVKTLQQVGAMIRAGAAAQAGKSPATSLSDPLRRKIPGGGVSSDN